MKHIELNNELMQRGADGFYQLEKDKEAVKAFMEEVDQKSVKFASLREKLDYLITNDYYDNVFDKYTYEQVEAVFNLTASSGFEFQSYMAISKFYKDYALKTNNKAQYLEQYPDRVAIVALHLGEGDADRALRIAEAMIEQRLQPATPTFLNAGKSRRGEMVSCFLL